MSAEQGLVRTCADGTSGVERLVFFIGEDEVRLSDDRCEAYSILQLLTRIYGAGH